MKFKLYILDVHDLQEHEELQQRAYFLMDTFRKEKCDTYKIMKDRLQQIAAGLLLQIGLLELEPVLAESGSKLIWETAGAMPTGEIFMLQAKEAIDCLEQRSQHLVKKVSYQLGSYGKPKWDEAFLRQLSFSKQFTEFNLSHSGQYAVLLLSDTAVGIDIQKECPNRIEGGCEAFSRMEAYVKCTGTGIAKGLEAYKKANGNDPKVCFGRGDFCKGYVLCVAFRTIHIERA